MYMYGNNKFDSLTCISITLSTYFIEILVEKWEYECYQVVLRYLPNILDSLN